MTLRRKQPDGGSLFGYLCFPSCTEGFLVTTREASDGKYYYYIGGMRVGDELSVMMLRFWQDVCITAYTSEASVSLHRSLSLCNRGST